MVKYQTKCQQITNNEKQCNVKPIKGEHYCFTHHPDYVTERHLAHSKGGLARLHYQPYSEAVELNEPADIQKLLKDTINNVLTGKMPSNNPANSIGFLARIWLDVYEISDLEKRYQVLEEKMKKNANLNYDSNFIPSSIIDSVYNNK